MKKNNDMVILIGMGIATLFAISTIVSYILSQIVPEIFTGVMEFSLLSTFFGVGLVGIGHILSIGKPDKDGIG